MGSTRRLSILGLNYPPERTGNAPYTGALAQELSSRDFEVEVITAFPHYPEWKIMEGYRGLIIRQVEGRVRVTRLRHYVPSRPSPVRRLLSELSFGIRLLAVRLHKPYAVLAVSPALFATALAVLKVRTLRPRPKLGVWVQDLYSLGVVETGTGGERTSGFVAKIESAVLRRADGVVVIHQEFKRHLVERLGLDEDKVEVIPNWTHLAPVESVDVPLTRQNLGWLEDEIVVLHAGNMGLKQGLENVVDAARLAQAAGAKVKFVLLGDGSDRARLAGLARGIASIQLLDPLDDPDFQAAIRAADILLVNERPGVAGMSVPSKLTSYLSAGRPVLAATDTSGNTAMELEKSGAGIVVEAGVPSALLEAALKLGSDETLSNRLAERGLTYYRDELQGARAAARFATWLESL